MCSILIQKNMQRNKSTKVHSRSTSTLYNHKSPVKLKLRTILKRRNDTITSSQLYQDDPTAPKSHPKLITASQSQRIVGREEYKQQEKKQEIREYVKKMGTKQRAAQVMQPIRIATQADEDKLSCRSNRSELTKSHVVGLFQPKLFKKQRNIEELQKKIQGFLSQNAQVLKKQRSSIGLSNWSQNRKSSLFERDIEQIIDYMNDLKLKAEENDAGQYKLQDLNKKIQMLERMIASQSIESEILKVQYSSWKNQRANTTSFFNKKQPNEAARLIRQERNFKLKKQIGNQEKKSTLNLLKFDSTSRMSYKKPTRQYYLDLKEKKSSYSLNRQPMPRSCYSAQYLNYGHIPTYVHKADDVRQFPETSLAVKASTYQQQYKQKLNLTKNMNFKQLDCFRDKFKNTDISFMKSSTKQDLDRSDKFTKRLKDRANVTQFKDNSNSMKLTRKVANESLIGCMNMSNSVTFFKSETQMQFGGQSTYLQDEQNFNKDNVLKSEIKNKQLQRYKNTFKLLAMRR